MNILKQGSNTFWCSYYETVIESVSKMDISKLSAKECKDIMESLQGPGFKHIGRDLHAKVLIVQKVIIGILKMEKQRW